MVVLNAYKFLMIAAYAILAQGASAEVPSAEVPPSYASLVYDTTSRAPPIPENEKGLQTIVAEPWFAMTDKTAALRGISKKLLIEGPVFDRQGNLLFAEVYGGRVMRLSPGRDLALILPENDAGSAGLSLHKDGRIFVAGIGDVARGSVFAIRADGSGKQVIVDPQLGYVPDDLAFDSEGGFYFTDMRGTNADPTGGVYHVAANMKTITPIMTGMSLPNGIALSADGKTLWVTEMGRGLLHRMELSTPTRIAPFGTSIPYRFVSALADSMRIDGDGNVYVALIREGRVMVFNPKGAPIGQILIPDRDRGEFLETTSMAMKPGTRELYILSSDHDGRRAAVYRAGAFAKGAIPPGRAAR